MVEIGVVEDRFCLLNQTSRSMIASGPLRFTSLSLSIMPDSISDSIFLFLFLFIFFPSDEVVVRMGVVK